MWRSSLSCKKVNSYLESSLEVVYRMYFWKEVHRAAMMNQAGDSFSKFQSQTGTWCTAECTRAGDRLAAGCVPPAKASACYGQQGMATWALLVDRLAGKFMLSCDALSPFPLFILGYVCNFRAAFQVGGGTLLAHCYPDAKAPETAQKVNGWGPFFVSARASSVFCSCTFFCEPLASCAR